MPFFCCFFYSFFLLPKLPDTVESPHVHVASFRQRDRRWRPIDFGGRDPHVRFYFCCYMFFFFFFFLSFRPSKQQEKKEFLEGPFSSVYFFSVFFRDGRCCSSFFLSLTLNLSCFSGQEGVQNSILTQHHASSNQKSSFEAVAPQAEKP